MGALLRVFAFGENAALQLLEFQARGFVFLQRVQIVEAFEEQQVGDLLDDFERIGDAASPEGIPECVNFAANFAGEHGLYFCRKSDTDITKTRAA